MYSLDCEGEGVWSSSLRSALVLAPSSASSPPVTSRLLLAPPSSPTRPPSSVPSWLVPSRATGRRRVRRAGEEGEGRAHVVPYCNLHKGPHQTQTEQYTSESVHCKFCLAHLQCHSERIYTSIQGTWLCIPLVCTIHTIVSSTHQCHVKKPHTQHPTLCVLEVEWRAALGSGVHSLLSSHYWRETPTTGEGRGGEGRGGERQVNNRL